LAQAMLAQERKQTLVSGAGNFCILSFLKAEAQ